MTKVLRNQSHGTVSRQHPFLLFHQAVDRTSQTTIIQGDYKLVKTWKQDRRELFDLSSDHSEAKDLSKSQPEKTRELHSLLVEDGRPRHSPLRQLAARPRAG